MKNIILFLGLIGILSGCVSHNSVDPATMTRAQAPVVCGEKERCDRLWQAAQSWIAQHSAYKIQLISDSVIQTYGPLKSNPGLAFRVVKEPGPYGTYNINIAAACGNIFLCNESPLAAVADFKDYLLGI